MPEPKTDKFKQWLCSRFGHKWLEGSYARTCKRCDKTQHAVAHTMPPAIEWYS